jgi:protein N-terminal amidase
MFKVATIQFTPEYGEKEKNVNRIMQLLNILIRSKIQLIVLPEMCLTGYVWPDKDSIYPLAEENMGYSFSRFSDYCKKNNCYLSYGFAEKHNNFLYNAQNLISNKGELLVTYRKVHLFEFDTFWAEPGYEGFKYLDLEFGRIGFGICMDINYDDFIEFHIKNRTDYLLFATNWVEEDIDVHEYWKMRLSDFPGTIFFSNRFGIEYDIMFSGRSAVYQKGEFISSGPKRGEHIIVTEHEIIN